MTTKRILCPVDFSPHSAAAVNYASCLAKEGHAKIYFLHVEENLAPYDMGFAGFVPSLRDLEHVQEALVQVVPAVPGLDYEHACVVGRPAEAILEFAKTHDIDLIVMGTHGRSGVLRLAVGSVAEAIVRRADCAVLTIKQPVDAPTT